MMEQGFDVQTDHGSIRKAAELTGLPWARVSMGHVWVTVGTWDITPNAGVPHARKSPGLQLEVCYKPESQSLGKSFGSWLLEQDCELIAIYEQ